MSGITRVTAPLLDVLKFMLWDFDSGAEETHGWAIMKGVKRSGPTVYGVLDRLEEAGWISSRWERENPDPKRPRRRSYRLTPNGTAQARALLAQRRPSSPTWV
jgi:PadR family transcriptional regulator, regulatory protein PadR